MLLLLFLHICWGLFELDYLLYFLRFSFSCPFLVGLTFYDISPSISVVGIILRQIQLLEFGFVYLVFSVEHNLLHSFFGCSRHYFDLGTMFVFYYHLHYCSVLQFFWLRKGYILKRLNNADLSFFLVYWALFIKWFVVFLAIIAFLFKISAFFSLVGFGCTVSTSWIISA